MDREKFKALRKLPGKEIDVDIEFSMRRNTPDHIVSFERVPVNNSLGIDVVAGGEYNRKTGRLTIYFALRESRKHICRFCVNGAIHADVGRTHKHELMEEGDLLSDLPHAKRREDLEQLSPRQVWETVCTQAGIRHNGNFVDP